MQQQIDQAKTTKATLLLISEKIGSHMIVAPRVLESRLQPVCPPKGSTPTFKSTGKKSANPCLN